MTLGSRLNPFNTIELHAVDRDQTVEVTCPEVRTRLEAPTVYRSHRSYEIGSDDLDRVDFVIQTAVVRRRVGDDHLPRTGTVMVH